MQCHSPSNDLLNWKVWRNWQSYKKSRESVSGLQIKEPLLRQDKQPPTPPLTGGPRALARSWPQPSKGGPGRRGQGPGGMQIGMSQRNFWNGNIPKDRYKMEVLILYLTTELQNHTHNINSDEHFSKYYTVDKIARTSVSQDVQTRFPVQLAFAKFLTKIK